jgi:DNA-binding MarR family transcriptional regulator
MDDRRIGIAELREHQRENWPQAYRDCQPSILRLLRSADDYLRASSEQLASHGLLPAEFDVLAALRRQSPPNCVSPTALCKALLMSSGGLTKLLKRLETAGLIERPANPDDGRSQLVKLSPAGIRSAEQAMATLCELQKQWLAPLADGQRQQLSQLLDQLLAR